MEFVRKDLSEFTNTMQNDTNVVATELKSSLTVSLKLWKRIKYSQQSRYLIFKYYKLTMSNMIINKNDVSYLIIILKKVGFILSYLFNYNNCSVN